MSFTCIGFKRVESGGRKSIVVGYNKLQCEAYRVLNIILITVGHITSTSKLCLINKLINILHIT